jgi:hypothetical protein
MVTKSNKLSSDFNIETKELAPTFLFVKLLLVLLLPHFIFVAFKASSLALGVLLVAIMLAPLYFLRMVQEKFSISFLLGLLTSFLFVTIYSVYAVATTDDLKPLYSLVLFVGVLISLEIKHSLHVVGGEGVKKVFTWLFLVLFLLGVGSLLIDIKLFNYGLREKPVFPFSEQSHFALTIGVIVLALISVSKPVTATFYVFFITLLAVIFPNLTLLVFSFLGVLILILRFNWQLMIASLFVGGILVAFLGSFDLIEIEYFSSRLSVTEANNLTTLVWIQGWLLAYLNFFQTHGIGLGVQSLGLTTTVFPETSSLIYAISGKINNATDGGFLASKIISEFGVFGVGLTVFYLFWLIGYLFEVNRFSNYSKSLERNDDFNLKAMAGGVVFAFLVEYFFRGYGYFSPTAILVLSFVLYLVDFRKKYENSHS